MPTDMEKVQCRLSSESMQDLRTFSVLSGVPYSQLVRDAVDTFAVLVVGCRDYVTWQQRLREAIVRGLGET